MKQLLATLILGLLLAAPSLAQRAKQNGPAIRFQTVDIYVNAKDQALAAYQLEMVAESGSVKIVGIEGGQHPAFRAAPYYDTRAIQREQVVIAAFNTAAADQLPTGKTRVAAVHVQITGDENPEYIVRLKTAATVQGEKVSAVATVEPRKAE